MIVAPGTTSYSIDVQILDDTGLAVTGLVAATFPSTSYSLGSNVAATSITLSDLAAITTTYTSGGVKERSGGWYRFDLPNAVLSSAGTVTLIGEASGKHLIAPKIQVQKTVATIATGDMADISATRAAKIDNLDVAVSSRSTYAGGAVASVTGNVGGNVTGSVGSVTAAVTLNASQGNITFSGLNVTNAFAVHGGVNISNSAGVALTITGAGGNTAVNIQATGGGDTIDVGNDGNGADTIAVANAGGNGSFCLNIVNAGGAALELSNEGGGTAFQVDGTFAIGNISISGTSALATESNATANKNAVVNAVGIATTAANNAATAAGGAATSAATAATQAAAAASNIASITVNGAVKLPSPAPAGYGGGLIAVTPITATVSTGEVQGGSITAYQNAVGVYAFGVTDGAGNAIDLTGKDVRFTASAPSSPNTPIITRETGGSGIVVSTSTATVSLRAVDTAAVRTLVYSLWNVTDDMPLAQGILEIKPIAQQVT